ncbi:MAG: hypothetical protein ACYDHD_09230 [Vulcanimicrobiaceae bacterium]
METAFDWGIVRDVGIGVGIFLFGLGTFVAALALARTLRRMNTTLDEVDRQLEAVGKPMSDMLEHVGGITQTAETTLARLSGVVGSLESAADTLTQTADLAKDAVSPAIVNVGATLSGVTAALRRLLTGRNAS